MDEEKILRENPAVEDDIATEYLSEQTNSLISAESISPATTKKHGRLRRVCRVLFYGVLPNMLAAFAVIVYASLAAATLSKFDFGVSKLIKNAVGEFVGGSELLDFFKSSDSSDGGISSSRTTVSAPDSPSPPSASLSEPEEENDTEDTASSDTATSRYIIDLSSSANDSLGLSNETPYDVDLSELLNEERAVPSYAELAEIYGNESPVVLILHTHATEAYESCAKSDYRSTDDSENVIAAGKVIADILSENGIPVLHCTEKFDYPDFNVSYYNAAIAIRKYIAEYPSISYILDIHRDSIPKGDGYAAPLTELDGKAVAQMMFVVGTDHGGSGHTGWRDNLALATRLQKSLSDECPALMRDINLRSASFNEQYTKGSLLIEIGSCASALDEVKNAAEILARHLANEIMGE